MLERTALTKMRQEKLLVTVEADTLNSILSDVEIKPGSLLKIDTEGIEMEVLKGAENTLNKFSSVITEASVLKRFEDSCEFPDLINYMGGRGFKMRNVLAAPVDKRGLISGGDLLFETQSKRAERAKRPEQKPPPFSSGAVLFSRVFRRVFI